jgi:hypothetical protein
VRELRGLLAEGDEKKKTEVYELTMALAVEWTTSGYSVSHLREGTTVLLDTSQASLEIRFDAFVARCTGTDQAFNCRFSVSWPPDVHMDADTKLVVGRPLGALSPAEADFYGSSSEQDYFLDILVSARDRYAARRLGEEKIANILAVLNLYLVQRRFEIKGRYVLIQRGDDAAGAIPLERSRQSTLQNVAEPDRRVNELIGLLKRLDDDDADQIMSSLQYHRLAMSASTDESCLVNMWIALECLARRGKGSIIETICTHIVPSVAVGNFSKLCRNLARAINPLWRINATSATLKLFKRSRTDSIDHQDLLDALLDDEKGTLSSELYRITGNHRLITYRIFRLRSRVFVGRDKAAGTMELHQKHIDWQLRRIYRARNQVMHHGRMVPMLAPLIQHLHTYLITALNNLVHDLNNNDKWGVPDALTHRQLLFSRYLQSISDMQRPISRQALLNPAQTLHEPADVACW